jgi:hypothetical protein
MMRRLFHNPRYLTGLTLAVLGLVLWAGVALALYQDPRETHAMKTPGALIALTYGDEPLVLGANWQEWLLRFQPLLQHQIGGAWVTNQGVNGKSLTIWENATALPVKTHYSRRLFLSNERGAGMCVDLTRGISAQAGKVLLRGHIAGQFPRRGAQIRIWQQREPGIVTRSPDYVLVNPAPGPYPFWKPDPTPATRHLGNLKVAVDRLEVDASAVDVFSLDNNLHLQLRIWERGKPAGKTWNLESATVTDPTGNAWQLFPFSDPSPSSADFSIYQARLPPSQEPACRLQLELAKMDNFPADEVWVVPNLQIPSPGRITQMNRRGKLGSYTVEILRLIGRETDPDMDGFTPPRAEIRVSGSSERRFLRSLRIPSTWDPEFLANRIENTAIVREGHPGSRWHRDISGVAMGTTTFVVTIAPTEGRRTTTLKLALARPRTFEFLVPVSPRKKHREARPSDGK